VNADFIFTLQQPHLGHYRRSDLLFIVKMRSIKTTEQFAKEIEEKEKRRQIIEDYVYSEPCQNNKRKTEFISVVNKAGNGAAVTAGDCNRTLQRYTPNGRRI
jgi:single-stranded DNA-specific DHH superfamily exonuclease